MYKLQPSTRVRIRQCVSAPFAGGLRGIIFGLAAILSAVHPLIHSFEGGGFDIILVNLDALLLQFDAMVPWHSYDHCDGHDEAVAGGPAIDRIDDIEALLAGERGDLVDRYMQLLDEAWRPCPELWESALRTAHLADQRNT